MTILFVCAGNTCRSPLAVAAWRSLDAEERQESTRRSGRRCEDRLGWRAGVQVGSAGLAAQAGAPASPRATEAARDWETDLSLHRARRFDEKLAREADLICAMTQQQAATVRARFCIAAEKVRVLGEYAARPMHPTHAVDSRDDAASNDVAKSGSDDDSQQKLATRIASREHNSEIERLLRLLDGEEGMTGTGNSHDIPDPFGGSLEAYRSCAAQIRRSVTGLRAALREDLSHRR